MNKNNLWASASEIKTQRHFIPEIKARLHKSETSNFAIFTSKIFRITAIILLTVLFCVICFKLCGVSATESGMLRNFINGGAI